MSNLSEFVARELREPTPAEKLEIQQRDLEERRQREAERHERELRSAFMAQPGATESDWTKEKGRILAEDRTARTVKQRDTAREQMARSYRSSF